MAQKKATPKVSVANLTDEQVKKALRAKAKGQLIIGDSEIEELCTVNKIRTGIPTLDYLSGGGITEGRMTTFAGNPSACKTTTCMQVIPAIQRYFKSIGQDKWIFYSDPEGAFDQAYARGHGVDTSRVIVSRTKVLEQAYNEAADAIEMGIVGAQIFDSIDGLVPMKTDDNAWGNTMGSLAGALSSHLPNLNSIAMANNVTTINIRQARVKMQTMSPGEIITISGGKAYQHFQTEIYVLKRLSNRNLDYTPIQINAMKTRSARMGLTLEMPLGNFGIDRVRDLMFIATNHGIINVGGGGWIEFEGQKVQGVDKLYNILTDDKEALSKLKDRVYEEVIDVLDVVCKSTIDDFEVVVEEETEAQSETA